MSTYMHSTTQLSPATFGNGIDTYNLQFCSGFLDVCIIPPYIICKFQAGSLYVCRDGRCSVHVGWSDDVKVMTEGEGHKEDLLVG